MNPFTLSNKNFPPRGSRQRAGFSLVEVTVATGIAAFGIISLLGLLPSGMNMFRDAMNVTVSSQIAQSIIKEAVQTDYDTLVEVVPGEVPAPDTPIVKPIRYFTSEGVELEESQLADAVFHAHTRIMSSTDLPVATGGVPGNSSLATVTVQVVLNPSNQTLRVLSGANDPLAGTLDPAGRLPFVTYTSHIAKIK